jgi:hypothetical protein
MKASRNKSKANKTESAASLEETGVSSKKDGTYMMFYVVCWLDADLNWSEDSPKDERNIN